MCQRCAEVSCLQARLASGQFDHLGWQMPGGILALCHDLASQLLPLLCLYRYYIGGHLWYRQGCHYWSQRTVEGCSALTPPIIFSCCRWLANRQQQQTAGQKQDMLAPQHASAASSGTAAFLNRTLHATVSALVPMRHPPMCQLNQKCSTVAQ